MQRKIITTADGSKTIQIEEWNEQYHSVHGAIQEANYVYLTQGLLFFYNTLYAKSKPTSLLEIGFGTGLNAILTAMMASELQLSIDYTGIEAYPVSTEELECLDYPKALQIESDIFNKIHECSWEVYHEITDVFKLKKQQLFFDEISDVNCHDIIYFDAFGARVQPELWSKEMFARMYKALRTNGVLVTYSAKGSVRRSLADVGFTVERLKGPPGKRHMLRAIKR